MLLSRLAMRVSFTPLGGRRVYWVTLGPILAPSISTLILNSRRVSWMICAFACTSPVSAGRCFFSRISRLGGCQLGSLTATRAWRCSAWVSCAAAPAPLRLAVRFFFGSLSGRCGLVSVGTPMFMVKSSLRVLLAAGCASRFLCPPPKLRRAFFAPSLSPVSVAASLPATSALALSSSVRVGVIQPHTARIMVTGEVRTIKRMVMAISSIYRNTPTEALTSGSIR